MVNSYEEFPVLTRATRPLVLLSSDHERGPTPRSPVPHLQRRPLNGPGSSPAFARRGGVPRCAMQARGRGRCAVRGSR